MKFDAKVGHQWKETLTKWADDFVISLEKLKNVKVDGIALFDNSALDKAIGLLKRMKDMAWAVADQLWAPMELGAPYLDFYGMRETLHAFIDKLEGVFSASPEAAAGVTPGPSKAAVKRDLAIATLVTTSALSVLINVIDYLRASFPMSVSVDLSAGPVVVNAGGSLSPINGMDCTLGLLGTPLQIVQDIIGSFMNVIDLLVGD